MTSFQTEGMRALITGAASGIGAEMARVFAASGARVALNDLDHEACEALRLSLPDPDQHSTTIFNVADSAAVAKGVVQASESIGGINAVVNCAGIWRPRDDGPIGRVTDDTWNLIIAVNLTGTFNVCREAVKLMDKKGGCSIVNLASVVAIAGWDKLSAYTASKGGVASFSRGLAVETASRGIRVNCICPGVIETPMTAATLEYSKPQVLPIGRLGRPEDIARAALFLSSDWSSFTTGVVLAVDGGFSAA